MIVVSGMLRQIVAAMTALSVLVCGVVCACPASAHTTRCHGDSVTTESHEHGHDHCSKSSQHEDSEAEHKESPAAPCHDHGSDSCASCDSTAIVRTEGNSVQVSQPLVVSFLVPFIDFAVAPPVQIRLLPAAASGIPPPAEWSTLLRLHCALII